MLTFDSLPEEVRKRVYGHCIPRRFEFVGARKAPKADWPAHPLLNLIRALPRHLCQEINQHIFESCRFEFIVKKTGSGTDGIDGCHVAREFFRLIGPMKFGFIRKIYCDLHWHSRSESIDEFFGMLEDFASCPPNRKLKNIPLEVKEAQGIRRSPKGGSGIPRCFSLLGLLGVDITILVLGARASWRVSRAATRQHLSRFDNEWIQQRNNSSQSFHFMGLPPELRLMVFRHLLDPNIFLSRRSHRIDWGAMLHLKNRVITREYLESLYKTCCFHFVLHSTQYFSRLDPAPWVKSFLRGIGHSVLLMRHIRIILPVHEAGSRIYTPSILKIINALKRYYKVKDITVDQNSPYTVLDQPEDSNFRYAFKAQTDDCYNIGIEVIVRKFNTLPVSQILYILGASMNGIPTKVDRHGRIRAV